jgi:hypothetical protein
MVNENVIDIIGGRYASHLEPSTLQSVLICMLPRHPLQEQIVDTFVPNDLLLVGGAGEQPVFVEGDQGDDGAKTSLRLARSVLICTGSNSCGKVSVKFVYEARLTSIDMLCQSVYLKQVRRINFLSSLP